MSQSITNLTELEREATASVEHAEKLIASEGGMSKRRHSNEAIDYMVDLLEGVSSGSRKSMYLFQEAMTLPDFPNLFGDTIDRAVLAYYKAWVPDWASYTTVGTVKDFRTAKRFDIQGMQAVLPAVTERAEYQERGPTDATPITLQAAKYGGMFGISFEALIDDDLGALTDLPQRLAVAARRTEAVNIAAMYCDVNGPNASVYTAGNKNKMLTAQFPFCPTNNMPLSITALGFAMQAMAMQLDPDGHPILIDAYTLVVPPALEVAANNILHATQFVTSGIDGGYGANPSTGPTDAVWAQNWLSGKLKVVVDPYIPFTATTANANTSWFLFADPRGARPAMELAYLVGHDAPELFTKLPNASHLGGGMVAEDFESDTVWYKIRHVFATAVIDPKLTFASNGSGS